MSVLDILRPQRVDTEALLRRAVEETAVKVRADVIEEFRRAVVATSPLPVPQAPGPSSHGAYALDNPYRYTVPQPPYRRPGSVVSLDTLRKVSDTYDVLRSCIQHLKREVGAVPLSIVAKDDGDDSDGTTARVKKATAFFSQRGGLGGEGRLRSEFEGQAIEDLCVIGAACVYYEPTRGGTPYQVECLDASTIRPRVDAYGWPGPGQEVWEQWIYGVKVAGYNRREMGYYGLSINARSWTPYFASQVEWLIQTILTALKADEWNAAWLTDGNVPSLMLTAPPDWTPEQIVQFEGYIDAIFSGNSQERQKVKLVPGGTSVALNPTRKDQDFEQFQLWLLRRTCAIMGVQPASVGFAGEQYKVSQQDSMESTSAFGVGVILDWRKNLYDDLLGRLGYDDLEVQNVTSREEEAKERAVRNVSLVAGGIKTPNEARQDEGLDPITGADELIVQNTMTTLTLAMKPPPDPVTTGAPGGNGAKPAPSDARKPAQRAEGPEADLRRADLEAWQRKALRALKDGRKPAVPFTSDALDEFTVGQIGEWLRMAVSADEVRDVFRVAMEDAEIVPFSRAEDADGGHWVTINGQAVHIGADGEIDKGPKGLVGKQTGADHAENAKEKAKRPGGDHEKAIDARKSHLDKEKAAAKSESTPAAAKGESKTGDVTPPKSQGSKEAQAARKAMMAEHKAREAQYKPMKKALDDAAEREFSAKIKGDKEGTAAAHEEWVKAATAAEKFKYETTRALRQHIRVAKTGNINVNLRDSASVSDADFSTVETGRSAFNILVGRQNVGGLEDVDVVVGGEAGAGLNSGRAYYDPKTASIHVFSGDHPDIMLHEMGHWLEDNDSAVGEKAKAFLVRRTLGQSQQFLKDITPGAGYGDTETAIPDAFMDPYMGSVYMHNGKLRATEIMSMGLQHMWSNPAKLATKDPDMFDFIYDTLRGN